MSNACRWGGYYVLYLYQNDNLNTYLTYCLQGSNCTALGGANDQTSSIEAAIVCNPS